MASKSADEQRRMADEEARKAEEARKRAEADSKKVMPKTGEGLTFEEKWADVISKVRF